MQQRQPRLGDILDDYCPRERRVTNHAVVAMVGTDVKQTRCTTCDAEHEYKHAKVPRQRRKPETPAALYSQVLASGPKRVAHENAGGNGQGPPEDLAGGTEQHEGGNGAPVDAAAREAVEAPPASIEMKQDQSREERGESIERAEVIEGSGEAVEPAESIESTGEAIEGTGESIERGGESIERGGESIEPSEDDGPVHRPLIRASLPRPEGQPPPGRPIPEFTIRQPGGRPNRFRPRHPRGGGVPGNQFQGGNRSNGNVAGGPSRGGMRQGGGRSPQGSLPRMARRHGPGRKRSK